MTNCSIDKSKKMNKINLSSKDMLSIGQDTIFKQSINCMYRGNMTIISYFNLKIKYSKTLLLFLFISKKEIEYALFVWVASSCILQENRNE